MTKRKILLPMITVGQGHKTAADALAGHIEDVFPGRFDLEVLDFTAAVGDIALDRRHKASWDAMLAQPWTAYWGQRLVDRVVPVSVSRWVQGMILADHARHVAPFIAARAPDLIVATHFFTVRALGMARRRHGLEVPVVGLNPDPLDSHALWTEPAVTEMIVFSEAAKRDLVGRGLPSERVSVFPYLMRPEFPVDCDRGRVQTELGLDPGAFTVLHSAGGQGIGGSVEAVVASLAARDPDLQYVVVCGRNEKLRERLVARAAAHRGRMRFLVTGFVTDMPRYICASDVVVGKAGPASTFEALVSHRPVLHTSFAAANEKAVLDYCVQHGVGEFIPDPADMAARLAELATKPQAMVRMRARIEELGLENGGVAIARHLVGKYLPEEESAQPPTRL